VEAGLACLRDQIGALDPDGAGVPAAGVSGDRWLLDGALRSLTETTGRIDLEYRDVGEPSSRRLWRALEDHEFVPVVAGVHDVDGLSWRLARILDRRDGAVLASACGPTADEAVRFALGDALARAQCRRARGIDLFGAALTTAALTSADAATIAELIEQVGKVCAERGLRLAGRRIAGDRVLGDLPMFLGWVRFDALR
jgi:hypothetical protein